MRAVVLAGGWYDVSGIAQDNGLAPSRGERAFPNARGRANLGRRARRSGCGWGVRFAEVGMARAQTVQAPAIARLAREQNAAEARSSAPYRAAKTRRGSHPVVGADARAPRPVHGARRAFPRHGAALRASAQPATAAPSTPRERTPTEEVRR